MGMQFTVKYRGKPFLLERDANSSLGDLGQEIVDLTGVAPHTVRLLLPKRQPLQPMSEQQKTILLSDSGIAEGMIITLMGSSAAEVASVSRLSSKDRTLGFSQEEQRHRQRSSYAGTESLPTGNYVFCDFRPLSSLPGVELNPPPEFALKIMHRLARDRGIISLMNKYHWQVGVMTEMPPVGYVGVSPKCLLGFNKNRGEEISLRLRTDDLKGFRKYESIKKTLLHELAHMVHDEHDLKFRAFDSQLNKEVISLDWTKSQGHTLSGATSQDNEEGFHADGGSGRARRPGGFRLGGNADYAHHVGARAAAVAAAVHRLGSGISSDFNVESARVRSISGQAGPSGANPRESASDNLGSQAASQGYGFGNDRRGYVASNPHSASEQVSINEPDPDDALGPASNVQSQREEPDPDEAMGLGGVVPGTSQSRRQEPDPDEATGFGGLVSSTPQSRRHEPDPDEAMDVTQSVQ